MTLGSGVKVEVPGVYLLFPDFCIHAQSIYQRTHPHQLRSFLVRWVGCHRSFRRSILCTFFTNKEKAKPLMKRQAVRSIRTNGNKKQRKKKGRSNKGRKNKLAHSSMTRGGPRCCGPRRPCLIPSIHLTRRCYYWIPLSALLMTTSCLAITLPSPLP